MVSFLVFVRSDRHPWEPFTDADSLSTAIRLADSVVNDDGADRAVVMEVSGVDAIPTFEYKYGTKK